MVQIVKSTDPRRADRPVWEVLRDFNGHDRWHPAVATSMIERGRRPTRSAASAASRSQDGSELREQLLTLSDLEQTFSYCLLDTPIPLFNYVAHVRLLPVTDGDRTFWTGTAASRRRPAKSARSAEHGRRGASTRPASPPSAASDGMAA